MFDANAFLKSLEPFANQGERDQAKLTLQTGEIKAYVSPGCSGQFSGGNTTLALESAGVSAGLSAIPVVGGALAAISGKIFGLFGAHHAAAVKKEQATLCQLVPAATTFLQAVDQLVSTGQLKEADAPAAMDNFYQQWHGMLTPILQDTGGHCNAACAYERWFLCAIQFRKNVYAQRSQGFGSADIFGGASQSGPILSNAAASVLSIGGANFSLTSLAFVGAAIFGFVLLKKHGGN